MLFLFYLIAMRAVLNIQKITISLCYQLSNDDGVLIENRQGLQSIWRDQIRIIDTERDILYGKSKKC